MPTLPCHCCRPAIQPYIHALCILCLRAHRPDLKYRPGQPTRLRAHAGLDPQPSQAAPHHASREVQKRLRPRYTIRIVPERTQIAPRVARSRGALGDGRVCGGLRCGRVFDGVE